MILGAVVQQPDERLDYDIKYDEWFAGDVDAINTATVEVISDVGDGGLTAQAVISSTTVVKLWVIGGDAGEEYRLEVTMTSVSGRVKQDELIVKIEEF